MGTVSFLTPTSKMCNIHCPNENIPWKLSTVRGLQQRTPKETKCHCLLLTLSRALRKLHHTVLSQWFAMIEIGYKVCMESNNSGLKQVHTLTCKILNEMASWYKEISCRYWWRQWFQVFSLKKCWFDSRGLIRKWKAWQKDLCKSHSLMAISHSHAAVPHTTPSAAAKAGVSGTQGPTWGKGSSPVPQRRHSAQKIWIETAGEALPTYSGFQIEVYSVPQVTATVFNDPASLHSYHLTRIAGDLGCCLYVFNRSLITLPFLAFITCTESTLQLDPVKV